MVLVGEGAVGHVWPHNERPGGIPIMDGAGPGLRQHEQGAMESESRLPGPHFNDGDRFHFSAKMLDVRRCVPALLA